MNFPGAPGNAGLSVSPSQIPESQRLQPVQIAPPTLISPGLLLRSEPTPGPHAVEEVPPFESQLLRQGTADERELTIYEQPLPGYDPLGMFAGPFLIFPSVDVSDGFNSNIYAAQTSQTSDQIFSLSPAVAVRSNFAQDQLNADISSANAFYVDHGSENYNDYKGSLNGRHYFSDTIVAFARANAGHFHEARISPNAQSSTEPTQYDDYSAYAGLAQTGLRLQLQADAFYERLVFHSVMSPSGPMSNGFQNHDQLVTTVRAGFELSHQLVAFIRGAFNNRTYPEFDAGFNRDSHGVAGDVGVDLDLNSVLVAEAFVGALHQDYADARFGSLTRPDLGVDAVWNVTPRTSILFVALRSIDETTVLPASGILTTTLSAGAQYQFLPNLQGRVDYSHSFLHFNDTGFDDDVDTISAGANYFLGRNIVLRPYVAYQTRDTNRPTANYGQVQAILDLTLRY